MDRRSALKAGFSAPLIAIAGCTGFLGDDSPERERPWSRSDTVTDVDGTHDLFVENHTETTETAWLRVVREDGAALVDGKYELPDGRGIEFDEIAAWGTTYTIDVSLDGEDVTTLEWYTDECRGTESPARGGSRNAGVRIEADDGDRIALRIDQCDAIQVGSLPTGPADYFRIEET